MPDRWHRHLGLSKAANAPVAHCRSSVSCIIPADLPANKDFPEFKSALYAGLGPQIVYTTAPCMTACSLQSISHPYGRTKTRSFGKAHQVFRTFCTEYSAVICQPSRHGLVRR